MPTHTVLPEDVNALKALLRNAHDRITHLETAHQRVLEKNAQLETRVLSLQEQLNLAIARRYAARSEKISVDQLRLFDETEVDAQTIQDDETKATNTITVETHTRQKTRGRKPLPDTLPHVDIVHELDVALRVCDHDGASLQEIGEVVSEQLDIIPATIQVLPHPKKVRLRLRALYQDRALTNTADSQEHGFRGVAGAHRRVQVSRRLTLASPRTDLATHRRRDSACDVGERDDPGRLLDPTRDQSVT